MFIRNLAKVVPLFIFSLPSFALDHDQTNSVIPLSAESSSGPTKGFSMGEGRGNESRFEKKLMEFYSWNDDDSIVLKPRASKSSSGVFEFMLNDTDANLAFKLDANSRKAVSLLIEARSDRRLLATVFFAKRLDNNGDFTNENIIKSNSEKIELSKRFQEFDLNFDDFGTQGEDAEVVVITFDYSNFTSSRIDIRLTGASSGTKL